MIKIYEINIVISVQNKNNLIGFLEKKYIFLENI